MSDDPAERIAQAFTTPAFGEPEAIHALQAPFDESDDGDSEILPDDDGDDPPQPRLLGFDVDEMNRSYALVLMGSKAVIMQQQEGGPIEDRVKLLTLDAFRAWFLNRPTEFLDKDGKIKRTTWAARWLVSRERRQYRGIEFFPDPDNAANTPGYFNLWQGFAATPRAKPNGYAIFRDHLLTNVCGGSKPLFDWVFGWFAHIMQRPRERIGTALVFRGKIVVGDVFGSLIASHFFLVDDPRYLVGQFNAHMASCLLLQADEGFWAGDKAAEGRLKGLVTAETQMIEAKGVDPIRLKNYVRLLITSNEDWVIPAGKDERRFCVIDVGSACAQNAEYFGEMYRELDDGGREALLHDLLQVDLSKVNLRQIPRTEALLEQKLRSLDTVESWWFERLAAGAPTTKLEFWKHDVPVDDLFDDYIASADKIGVRRKSEMTAFGIKMRRLIPDLKRQRLSVSVGHMESRRLWCYLLPPLNECREVFEREINQAVAWDRDSEP